MVRMFAGSAVAPTIDQPLDHGGRGEHRHARPGGEQAEDLVRLEAAGFRHHVDAEPRHMRHHVEAGAVAHRRGVQDRVAGRDRVDLGQIGKARLRQHAMGQHRALRPAGGAGGVEQPGEIVAVARRDRHRVGGEQRVVFGAADHDQAFEACRRVRRDLGVEARRTRSTRARRNARGCSQARARAAWRSPAPRRARRARCRRASRDSRRSSSRRSRRGRRA